MARPVTRRKHKVEFPRELGARQRKGESPSTRTPDPGTPHPQAPPTIPMPAVQWRDDGLLPANVEPFTPAWWALGNPPPRSPQEKELERPPPDGFRYRPDGKLVPVVDTRYSIRDPIGQSLFVEVLQYTGSLRAAMDAIGLGLGARKLVDEVLNDNESFQEQVQAALDRHRDSIYIAAVHRAVHGVDKPLLGGKNKDQIICYERVYSDSLTALLLKRHFQEFRQADARPGGATVNVNQNNVTIRPGVDVRKLTKEQRAHLRALASPAADAELDLEIAAETQKVIAEQDEDAPLGDVIDVPDSNCKAK